jgi:hypothetical protein
MIMHVKIIPLNKPLCNSQSLWAQGAHLDHHSVPPSHCGHGSSQSLWSCVFFLLLYFWYFYDHHSLGVLFDCGVFVFVLVVMVLCFS